MRTPPPVAAGLVALGMAGAILLAAIHPPGEFVGNGTFSAGLLALGLAAIAGATLRGADRAYWAGFALVGSGYLVLVYGPWFDLHTAPLLITETAFRGLEQRYGPYQRLFYGVVSEQGQFAPRLIGHTLSALILAAVGGEAARRFATAGPGVAVASEEGVG